MIQLIVDNSYSRLSGLSDLQHRGLRALLSYKIDPQQTYFSNDWRGGKRSLFGKRGDFPTGLLAMVQTYLNEQRVFYDSIDTRTRPTSKPGMFVLELK